MRFVLMALLLTLPACAIHGQAPGQAVQEGERRAPQLLTSGVGRATLVPDRARITVAVQTQAATAAAAAARNAELTQAVLAALRREGLQSEQLSTSGYNVMPEYQHDREGRTPPRVVSYRVVNSITADIRDVSKVGSVIDAAISAGANSVSTLQFYSSNSDAARRTAIERAMTTARGDAEALARAAGGRLGALLEVSTTSGSHMPPPIPFGLEMAQVRAAAPTPIEPGEQEVTATVTARWEFIPGS